MKKLLIAALFLAACTPKLKTSYTFKVTYTEGCESKTAYTNEIQWLANGCLGLGEVVVCGNYNIKKIN